jgi:hypothetical protein
MTGSMGSPVRSLKGSRMRALHATTNGRGGRVDWRWCYSVLLDQADNHPQLQNDQRQRRKDEAAQNLPWQLVHFNHVESDGEYSRLAGMLHDKLTPAHEDAYVFKG